MAILSNSVSILDRKSALNQSIHKRLRSNSEADRQATIRPAQSGPRVRIKAAAHRSFHAPSALLLCICEGHEPTGREHQRPHRREQQAKIVSEQPTAIGPDGSRTCRVPLPSPTSPTAIKYAARRRQGAGSNLPSLNQHQGSISSAKRSRKRACAYPVAHGSTTSSGTCPPLATGGSK